MTKSQCGCRRACLLFGVAGVATLLTVSVAVARGQSQAAPSFCVSSDVRETVERTFCELSGIRPMEAGKRYTLSINDTVVTGAKEEFLRRRSAPEIIASQLGSGCGDYAVAFIYLIEKCGIETMLVDAAEISLTSLRSRFSGHAVVAVRDEVNNHWILADPTNKRILAEPWSPDDKMFGQVYWIGFRGPLAKYPVNDALSLREFYGRTLKTIPPEILNQHVFRIRFTIDTSLIGHDGGYLNPNVTMLPQNSDRFLAENGLSPQNEVTVRVVRGEDSIRSSVEHSGENGWTLKLGLQSGCGPGLLGVIERAIADRMRAAKMSGQ